MSTEYRSAPEAITTAPRGIPYIVTNEAAERFSFYGMKGILMVFMTQYLLSSDGSADFLDQETAMVWYHNFTSAVYFFPLIGALIADWFIGIYGYAPAIFRAPKLFDDWVDAHCCRVRWY